MEFYNQNYYHFYNRTINREQAFREPRNYHYFLTKYRRFAEPFIKTLAYCLMPTHFHFLIQIQTTDTDLLKKNIGIFLSSYSKAFNKAFDRHGSLFEQHSKAIPIADDAYLITLIHYIHQNPLRAGLVERLEEWPFSSYPDLSGLRKGTLPDSEVIERYYEHKEDFISASHEMVKEVNSRYWV